MFHHASRLIPGGLLMQRTGQLYEVLARERG
jgi:hypothetical protein